VICVLAYDREPGWSVNELGDQHFSVDLTSALPLRRFVLFGYSGETWALLGEPSDQQIAIEAPGLAGQEREQAAARYGAILWDAAWLEATFGACQTGLPCRCS
jgi:hypothetical protein